MIIPVQSNSILTRNRADIFSSYLNFHFTFEKTMHKKENVQQVV